MATRVKIKIFDCPELRDELDGLYAKTDQVTLAKWALLLAKRSLKQVRVDDTTGEILFQGFQMNEQWQVGAARIHDVRQAGFRIHQCAKEAEDEMEKTALRVAGQAVSTGHMREHAMVASDYAVKRINLLYPNDIEAVREERNWQIEKMKALGRHERE